MAIAIGILSASAAAAKGYGFEVQPYSDADQPSDSFFGEELFGAAPQLESTYRLGEFRAKGQAPGASDYVSSSSSSQGTIFDTADYDLPSLKIQTPLLAQADIAQDGSTSAPEASVPIEGTWTSLVKRCPIHRVMGSCSTGARHN